VSRPRERARLAGLHVLADDDPRWKWDPVEQARAACAGGAAVVQLRAKRATDRQILAWAEPIREAASRSGALFLMNDRFDLALAVAADGVHLGQQDLPPGRIPRALRERLLLGRSTHDGQELLRAQQEPIDYVAFGPVFETHSKDRPAPPRGLQRLREAVALAAGRPLVAIGGILPARVPALRAAGAAGVAVISAVAGAEEPVAATRALVAALAEPGA